MSLTCAHLDQVELHRHASAHARRTDHAIARSAEPGEDWSWCYVDQVAFVIEASHGG